MAGFLLVDRILELVPGVITRGIKHVSATDPYLCHHSSGEKIFWPSLVGETLGQLCAWNVMSVLDFKYRPVAGVCQSVRVEGEARVGDTIFLEASISELDDECVRYQSTASVDGKTIFTLENALGPLLPMSDFIELDLARAQFQEVYRPGDWPQQYIEKKPLSFIEQSIMFNEQYDHIIESVPGKQLVAVKTLSRLAPYLADHFPRKPVLPLTVLLHCKVGLAHLFLRDLFGEEIVPRVQLIQFMKIKMSQFIQPGDCIETTLTVKSLSEDRIILQYLTTLAGQRACIAQAEFRF